MGLGGANVMSNSMGSEDEERAQRRVRMGRKRGKGLVLRKEAAKDIGDDATEAIFADGGWGE